jgi:hypothetical protein
MIEKSLIPLIYQIVANTHKMILFKLCWGMCGEMSCTGEEVWGLGEGHRRVCTLHEGLLIGVCWGRGLR